MINYYEDLKKDIRPKKKMKRTTPMAIHFSQFVPTVLCAQRLLLNFGLSLSSFFWLALVIERDFLTFKPSSWKNFQPWPQGLAHCEHICFEKRPFEFEMIVKITRFFIFRKKRNFFSTFDNFFEFWNTSSSLYFETLLNVAKKTYKILQLLI